MSSLYFDFCAAVVLLALIFSIVFRKMTKGVTNRLFMLILVVTLTADLFDIAMVILELNIGEGSSYSKMLLYFLASGYLLVHNLTVPVYLLFIIGLTDTWHKLKKNRLEVLVFLIPSATAVIAMAVNLFTKSIFYYDENYRYTRGPAIYILYVCAFTNMLICLAYLWKYRTLFSQSKFAALLSMIPFELAAIAIQWFYPNLLLEMFANAVTLFLTSTTVQRPEELLDSVTALGKYDAYASDMKKNFANEKHVTMILIDVSNFSSLHSILNFDGANQLLREIALKLRIVDEEIRTHAELYSLDNGKFCCVINESYRNLVDMAAEKISAVLKESILINNLELNLVSYVCVIRCPEDIADFKSLIQFGNELHERHAFSGDVMYVSDMVKQNSFELTYELDRIIDTALANGGFQVYYQPIYSTQKKRFTSAEALLRLIDEKHGFISPELFITAAEKSGAIHKIGDYVMEEVCRFIAGGEFEELGLDYIEINLSVAQCMQSDLADRILRIMRKYNVLPEKINLEITETAASYAQNIMTENINRLFEAGISFSLDDFGTGYSNIQRVASLPLSIVKLDKTFATEEDNPKMWIVLQNTIKMLKDMQMYIVVEGIETRRLLEKFTELQCEYIQGYYFSKPIPKDEFVHFILKSIEKTGGMR